MIFTDCLAIRCTHAVVQHQPAGCIFLLQHKAQALAGQLQVAVGCVIEKVCPFARADRDLPGEFPGALNQGLSALRKPDPGPAALIRFGIGQGEAVPQMGQLPLGKGPGLGAVPVLVDAADELQLCLLYTSGYRLWVTIEPGSV